ncbi:MAG: hypothetical protein Q8N23_24720 [Archangium sp.]|nr:hypothetical protein [Archangium sp.]MDP3155899.1 hypothetical protein [Archangium sp.]MDP3574411.1 hypothetical protein [Archangium sp.]
MRSLLFSSVLLAACTGAIQVTPPPAEIPAMGVVMNAPVDRPRPHRTTPGEWSSPSALWLQDGEVTVLDGALVRQRSGDDFSTLEVAIEPGVVKALSRRGAGVMVAATGGFFHDAPGRLLRAPVSDDFAMSSLRFVDVVGAALWVTTSTDATRVLDGHRETVRINDASETGAVQAIIGRSSTAALLVKGASLYAVDLEARTVKTLARGVGTVTAIDHRGDVALIGTSEGLLEVATDGSVSRHTLSATDVGQAIVDIEVVGELTLVTTTSQVLQLGAVIVVLADVTQAWPDALTKDVNGDVWFLDGASLVRLSTSVVVPPPSFAADVKPFMTAHCRSCHATGANYAPQLNLENYAVARNWAVQSLNRITDTVAPMPPANREVLTPAQYDVVVRWVEGGLLP